MVVPKSQIIIVPNVNGHHGHHLLIVQMHAMVRKADIEHMMDQIVQIIKLKKINNHVLQIVQLYVMKQLQMVQLLNIMLVILLHKHVVIDR
jgi:hypothetical protein